MVMALRQEVEAVRHKVLSLPRHALHPRDACCSAGHFGGIKNRWAIGIDDHKGSLMRAFLCVWEHYNADLLLRYHEIEILSYLETRSPLVCCNNYFLLASQSLESIEYLINNKSQGYS